MKQLRSWHAIAGIAGIVAFLISGQYMHHFLGHLHTMPDGPRLLYRTAHIYLLWSALLNMLLGAYFTPIAQGRLRLVQCVASIMLLASPILIGYSFFTESVSRELIRPNGRLGIYLAFAGCLMHAFVALAARPTPASPLNDAKTTLPGEQP